MDDQCHVALAQKVAGTDDLNEARIAALKVEGMGCVNCAARVHNALLALDGVVSADVDWERGLAIVDYVPAKTNGDALVRAIAGASDDGRHIYRAEIIASKEIV